MVNNDNQLQEVGELLQVPQDIKLIGTDLFDKKSQPYWHVINPNDYYFDVEKGEWIIVLKEYVFKFDLLTLDQEREKIRALIWGSINLSDNKSKHINTVKQRKSLSTNRALSGYQVLSIKQQRVLWLSSFDYRCLQKQQVHAPTEK